MIKIKDYINNNYNISGNLTFENINEIYIVNCDGEINIKLISHEKFHKNL